MPKLNDAAIRVLAAAQRGELHRNVSGSGYAWIDLNADDGGGRVTATVNKLLNADPPLLKDGPRHNRELHVGRPLVLTETGRAALDASQHGTNR